MRGADIREGPVRIREIRRRDRRAWSEVRTRSAAWLAPWEATVPDPAVEPLPTFNEMVRRMRAEARAGRMLPLVIEYSGGGAPRLAGQLTVAGISYGSLRSAQIGYWVDRDLAGRGIAPTAVAMAIDYCFFTLQLHRIELAIRPENRASLRVAEKLGLRPEGLRERFLHIDGEWRDHAIFALTIDEAPNGVLPQWKARHAGFPT